MEEGPTAKGTITRYKRTASTAGRVALGVALPAELDGSGAVVFGWADVHPVLDRDEPKAALLPVGELDERRTEEIDRILVPEVRLHDAPPARELRHLRHRGR